MQATVQLNGKMVSWLPQGAVGSYGSSGKCGRALCRKPHSVGNFSPLCGKHLFGVWSNQGSWLAFAKAAVKITSDTSFLIFSDCLTGELFITLQLVLKPAWKNSNKNHRLLKCLIMHSQSRLFPSSGVFLRPPLRAFQLLRQGVSPS